MKNKQFVTLIVLILVSIFSIYYISIKQSKIIINDVISKFLEIEYNKVGGIENYKKINQIQKQQIIEGLKQYENQNGKIKIENNVKEENNESGNIISLEKLKKITSENTYVIGNPNAEITWVEYSDLECPFCKKLHESGTIEEIIKLYDGKVNFIFKQFPLGFHPKAQMEAEAALCVGDLGGKDKYYDFITKTFKNSKTNGNSYSAESISKLGGSIGVNQEELLKCINSGKFKQQVQDQISQGADVFGITGTPGNVLINNKTGKWDKLPGAYPTASFKKKIDNLLK